ncbi:MAG: hypothetical protein KKE23_03940 [Nanoarchaeota archaeon]|nr:hypothetical protein [Nanoarchaeota archaeon]
MSKVKKSQAVKDLIENVLREMASIRKERGQWTDDDNKTPGIIMSCEALESFFIPSLSIPGIGSNLLNIIDLETIKKTIEYVSAQVEEKGFAGSPYVNFTKTDLGEKEGGKDGKGGDIPVADSASFVVCAFLDAKRLLGDKLDNNLVDKMDKQIIEGLQFLKDSHAGDNKGWAWGKIDKKFSFLYFTWTTIEALELIFSEKYKGVIPSGADLYIQELKIKSNHAQNWIVKTLIEQGSENEFKNDLRSKKIDYTEGDESLYYTLWALIVLLLTGHEKKEEIDQGLKFVMKYFNESSKVREQCMYESFAFRLDGDKRTLHREKYEDRSFVPLMLKALTLHIFSSPEKQGEFHKDIEEFLNLLLGNKARSYNYVWDTAKNYSIFYTERAIEALTRLYLYYEKFRIEEELEEEAIEEVSGKEVVTINIPIAHLVKALVPCLKEAISPQAQPVQAEPDPEKIKDLDERLKKIEKDFATTFSKDTIEAIRKNIAYFDSNNPHNILRKIENLENEIVKLHEWRKEKDAADAAQSDAIEALKSKEQG